MTVFVYDKTFEGLLCAVFDAYTLRLFPDTLVAEDRILPLSAGRTHTVAKEQDHFDRVYAGLRRKLSARAFRHLKYAWLSEEPGSDLALFTYIRKVFDAQSPVEGNLADPDMFAVETLSKKVSREAHHLLGFIRFQKTADGVYAATVSPRHNVLPLLLRHFTSRFARQSWLIYDLGRQVGVLRDARGYHDVHLDRERAAALSANNGRLPACELDPGELKVQELWKTYFTSASIKERRNPRLQARCMPRRFWRYLTEKQP